MYKLMDDPIFISVLETENATAVCFQSKSKLFSRSPIPTNPDGKWMQVVNICADNEKLL